MCPAGKSANEPRFAGFVAGDPAWRRGRGAADRTGRMPAAIIRGMKRIAFATAAIAAAAALGLSAQQQKRTSSAAAAPAGKRFTVVEATIPEMRAAMEQGRVTSREIVRQYLERIGTYEDRLH